MQRPRALAALAVLGALGASFLVGPAGAIEPACSALAADRALQDDAASGRDAGDAPGGAAPIREENYVWGFLDVSVGTGAADLDDWFEATVPSGPREVTFGIVASPWYTLPLPPDTPYLYPPLTQYHLDGWAPGATTPVRTSVTEGNRTVHSEDAGLWLFHAYVDPYLAAPVCAGPGEVAHVAELPQQAQNYGVYFGCDPVCLPRTMDGS